MVGLCSTRQSTDATERRRREASQAARRYFGVKRLIGGVAERSIPMRVEITTLSRPRDRTTSPIQRSTLPSA